MQKKFAGLVGVGVMLVCGCSERIQLARKSPELGSLYAAVEVSLTNGVTAVLFEILPLEESCGGNALVSETISLQEESLPNVTEEGGTYAFANGFFILDAGTYRVCAVPMANALASEVCSPAETTVEIEGENTTEVALVSQCAGENQGGLDVVVSLNGAPTINQVTLSPSKFISECDSLTAVATATDPNLDALTYSWSVSAGPAGANLQASGATATFSGPAGQYSLELAVNDGHGGINSLEFPVEVSAADCNPDVTPPPGVSALQAVVEARRETSFRLSWTPPSESVAGYDIAYLAVAAGDTTTTIDDSNFASVSHAPDAPGSASSVVVSNLHIEQRYLFAVRPYDAAGNLGPVVATGAPLRAQFQTLVLTPPPNAVPGTQWGYSIDASTDLDGDGAADLIVGQKYGDAVYVYLGQVDGTYSNTPTSVISGPAYSSFGSSVAVVGNIIGDAHEDLVIAAPTDGLVLGRVYIVDGQELLAGNLDLSSGKNPTGSIIDFPNTTPYPAHVVRLGDFDGDGDPDFAIHALGYGAGGPCDTETLENCDGALLWIKGETNPLNFPGTITVPNDTARFEAYFPSSLGFYGGDWLLGITDLVGGRSGVLAAEYQAGVQRLITQNVSEPSGFDAQLLDYGPPQYTGEVITYDTEIGSYPAALVGGSSVAIQLTNARNGLGTTPGVVDIYTLSSTNTFTAPSKTFKASGQNNNFGQILIGNRHSGRPSSYSLPFFGSDAEGLIMGARTYANKLPRLFMVGADKLASVPSGLGGYELSGNADVEYSLSEVPGVNPDWTDELGFPSEEADWHGGLGFAVHDMNGDGYADIGVTEWEFEAVYTGGIIILY